MTATSTNLHFHGLTIPSTCHQDEVINTSIQPQDGPFQYRFRIPANEPPGLYWYHPHIHGFSKAQVLGGASGAIIVEGMERAVKEVAGLPERVLVIRDRDLPLNWRHMKRIPADLRNRLLSKEEVDTRLEVLGH
jgi:FtsP/CotA-like multicopper oxidase with cupredoxin domain